jgi:hypothetical protein
MGTGNDSRQMTDDSRQRIECGIGNAECGNQLPEYRGQRIDDRRRMTDLYFCALFSDF